MAFVPCEPMLGLQPFDEVSTTQQHPLGTIVQGRDPTHGVGEFIYLEGVANTAAGHGVTYSADTFQTALASIVGGTTQNIAIALAATVADTYGWYQIAGRATVKKASATSFAAAAALGITSGLAVAAATNKRLTNAVAAAAASGASAVVAVTVAINRPGVSPAAET